MSIKKISKKIILITVVIMIVLVAVIYQFFVKNGESEFTLEKVSRGTVSEEVSETGTVKISEEIKLSFKNSGRIEKIYVKTGDVVEIGQGLAKLDTSQLYIELTEAQAALEVAQAKKKDTQVSLESAKQSLEDVKDGAEEDLNNAYQDALTVLDDCRLKIYNAYNTIYKIQQDYFTSPSNEDSIEVIEEKYTIKSHLEKVETYVDDAKDDPRGENIDFNLSEVKKSLEIIDNSLKAVQDIVKSTAYYQIVSDTDKTSLDTQRSNIITAVSNIVNAQQTISTVKVNNEANINTAEASVSELEKQLQNNGGVSGLYDAQMKQAQARVYLLQNQLQEATLKSPNNGQITKANKREGEIVQPTDSVFSFLPTAPLQIKVDIYEEDIVKVNIGNPVKIDIPAFPNDTLKGRVISIDPAEKLVDGVVYYEVTIDFEETKEGIKPGMTADIIIEAEKKENVLVVSRKALKRTNGKKLASVFKDGKIEEREIEIGLEGDGLLEIVSGLSEGEEVVVE